MKHRRLTALAVSGALIASGLALHWTTTEHPAAAQAAVESAPAVQVAEIVKRRLAPSARFTGHLEAAHVVEITPRVGGLLVAAPVPEGQRVEAGDLLFRIDSAPFQLKLAHARADVDRALAQAELARSDHARLLSLSERGTSSRRELEVAGAERAIRDAEVAAAHAALKEAELQLSYTAIRSPIAGVADRILIQPGNQVAGSSSEVLTRVVSADELFVTFHIDEANYSRLDSRLLSALTVEVYATSLGEVRPGKLDFSAAQFDRSTGTIRARAILDNGDGRLKPGMFVRVKLPLAPASDALLVAESAIRSAPGGRYVLVVDDKGEIQQRTVILGAAVGELRVISAGLSQGDRIVLKGLVQPGMTVDPVVVAMPSSDLKAGGDAS